jgi:hypothetical protein
MYLPVDLNSNTVVEAWLPKRSTLYGTPGARVLAAISAKREVIKGPEMPFNGGSGLLPGVS